MSLLEMFFSDKVSAVSVICNSTSRGLSPGTIEGDAGCAADGEATRGTSTAGRCAGSPAGMVAAGRATCGAAAGVEAARGILTAGWCAGDCTIQIARISLSIVCRERLEVSTRYGA